MKDITGERFGKLTAIELTDRSTGSYPIWRLRCDCGNIVERRQDHLSEKSSCGCARRKDLSGQRFGRLTVISFVGRKNSSQENYWLCQCDCGNTVELRTASLTARGVKSCGCLKREKAKLNNYLYKSRIGERYGMLTVIEELSSGKDGVVWRCKCDCGNEIDVFTNDLTSGKKRSCGCVDNRLYCVYKHVSPEGKVYVGTTTRKPHTIWFNGHLYDGQHAMSKAIEEVGGYKSFKSVFKHYYLDANETWVETTKPLPFEVTNVFTKEKAGSLYTKYIQEYRSADPDHGYNARTGGFKVFNYIDAVKERQSKLRTGEDNRSDWMVYCHTNKANGKVYIGITSKDNPNDRWQSGEGYKRPRGQTIALSHFYNAIKKYGWDNFEHEILVEGLTLEQASEYEQKHIKQYDSTNPEKGYNIAKGGKGTVGAKHSLATKKLLSDKAKRWVKETGIINFKGEHHTEETKKIMSEKAKNRIAATGVVNFKGCHHTKETKAKLSKLRSTPVTMYDLNGKKVLSYESVSAAAEAVGVSIQSISACIHGNSKMSAGHIWRHIDVDQLPESEMPNFNHALSKAVDQFSKDGVHIASYPSLKTAAAAVGVSSSSLLTALKRGTRSAGCIWKYKQPADIEC